MEDGTLLITITETEALDSTSSNSNSSSQRPKSFKRPNKQIAGSSRFKGVVYQQNGHWGAQIYANHSRIWLGTFKTEADAATAYDSASIMFRQRNLDEAHRNFPWTTINMYEPNFQAQYTTDQILNMIKDGSYPTKFSEYLYSISQVSNGQSNYSNNQNERKGYFCRELFRKELTPSDVGKLNRLVIPKRHALKYFPVKINIGRKFGVCEEDEHEGRDMELVLYDNKMKSWKFRYCYWKSSQSFVFTSGWNRFVRVKELEAKDIVTFYMCELKENNGQDVKKFWMIDIVKYNAINQTSIVDDGTLLVQEAVVETKKDKRIMLFGVSISSANSDEEI
ncbi:AP2/ERF and B3 domain-containing transcription factor At1g50680-like [Spinacia oleracea]|uniref:AP2/ERF and B3 domain-containing transcription factor At1g50680-like n=1 Tax=Spinacia oleracea TaxID=3562 RepID=A0ABM3R1U3_SPIOL|nr:AP2/ERF and B3 domain-containing transcription factor At1g50680-like [Spinacia oleracea]